jgi:uncharacterized membrane protein YfcA
LLAEYAPWIIGWCFFALWCGGFIKGALGVGTPLLTVPMMALVLPPQMAIAIMAIPVVVANLWQFAQAERSTAVIARFWPTFLAILVGTWVGVKILSVIDEKTLLVVVGISVIGFALLQGSRFRLHLPDPMVKPAGLFFGGASGLIGGLSSFFGPMLIVYLISIDQRMLIYSALATIPVTIGLLIGQRIRRRISDARFQYLIIGILVVSGCSMLWRAYN